MSNIRTFDAEFAEILSMEGPLHERLTAVSRIIAVYYPDLSAAYDDVLNRLKNAATFEGTPNTGDAMPPFFLPSLNQQLVSLESLLGFGPVVISFNRGYWCDYCSVELKAYANAHQQFARSGAKVVSIMPDRLEYLAEVSERNGHAFLVLCDLDNSYGLELNLVMWLGDRIAGLMRGIGLPLDRIQGNPSCFVPLPATFVLDENGIILARYVDPDFRKRMEVTDVLDVIAAHTRSAGA
jgi:peroxiredoxin